MTAADCPGTSCRELCTAAGCKCPPCGTCPPCRRRAAIANAPAATSPPELKPPTGPPGLDPPDRRGLF